MFQSFMGKKMFQHQLFGRQSQRQIIGVTGFESKNGGFDAPSKRIRIETCCPALARARQNGFDAPSKRIQMKLRQKFARDFPTHQRGYGGCEFPP